MVVELPLPLHPWWPLNQQQLPLQFCDSKNQPKPSHSLWPGVQMTEPGKSSWAWGSCDQPSKEWTVLLLHCYRPSSAITELDYWSWVRIIWCFQISPQFFPSNPPLSLHLWSSSLWMQPPSDCFPRPPAHLCVAYFEWKRPISPLFARARTSSLHQWFASTSFCTHTQAWWSP